MEQLPGPVAEPPLTIQAATLYLALDSSEAALYGALHRLLEEEAIREFPSRLTEVTDRNADELVCVSAGFLKRWGAARSIHGGIVELQQFKAMMDKFFLVKEIKNIPIPEDE